MKAKIAVLLALLLVQLCAVAHAQEYYTLLEIREQAAEGWHETYTDKYGRTRQVDIDIEVFGEETAPVVKACWGDPQVYEFTGASPFTAIKEARLKGKGESIYPYENVGGMRVDLDQRYAEKYGNDLTLREVYDFLGELMDKQGLDQDYVCEQPSGFSVLYSADKKTGGVLVPALYSVYLWPREFGLPILSHVAYSFERGIDAGYGAPKAYINMRDQSEYLGGAVDFDVEEILAGDIPLCSVDKAIEGARQMIEEGYIQQVLSLRFGYVVYCDPDEERWKQKSMYDVDTWYLVPSWVMDCYILDDPKVDELPEYPGITEMTINAQTGEMMDYFDTSLYTRGDPRYKGFIAWNDVK